MSDRSDFQAAKTYTGQKIEGLVDISYKIDGVRILAREEQLVTRNNKTPPGLSKACTFKALAKLHLFGDCEIYLGDFFASNGPLSRHDPEENCINTADIYPLDSVVGDIDHCVDPRLYIETIDTPSPEYIKQRLQEALDKGYEGLVLRVPGHWYRVKPEYTADVFITGWFEQLDKHKNPKGVLGGFNTNYGKVTAFTDEDRVKLWDNPQQYVDRLMNCQYKELYHTGKFRYCVKFLNIRTDKSVEVFDTKAGEIVTWGQ